MTAGSRGRFRPRPYNRPQTRPAPPHAGTSRSRDDPPGSGSPCRGAPDPRRRRPRAAPSLAGAARPRRAAARHERERHPPPRQVPAFRRRRRPPARPPRDVGQPHRRGAGPPRAPARPRGPGARQRRHRAPERPAPLRRRALGQGPGAARAAGQPGRGALRRGLRRRLAAARGARPARAREAVPHGFARGDRHRQHLRERGALRRAHPPVAACRAHLAPAPGPACGRVARRPVAGARQGGSTLRDYVGSDGAPGHFQLEYAVYGRAGEPCPACGAPVRVARQAGRSTFYCPSCQR